MTVSELINKLEIYDPQAVVILSKDSEGNTFTRFSIVLRVIMSLIRLGMVSSMTKAIRRAGVLSSGLTTKIENYHGVLTLQNHAA